MRAQEFVTEVSQDWAEINAAAKEVAKIYLKNHKTKFKKIRPDDIKKMAALAKITGRASTVWLDGPNIRGNRSVGYMLDDMVDRYRELQIQSGQMPEFTGRAPTAGDMALQIAQQTRGQARYQRGRTWTTGRGSRYRDPEFFVEYPDESALDDAWQWLESRGKKVYYKDSFQYVVTAIKIGRYVVEPASFTQGPFSGSPETTHRISIRSAASINQGVRTQVDITDQQAAALSDIAATKNATAMASIQAIMSVLQGEEDIKRVIDNSRKIDPRDKAKLDAIIAGAGNFRKK
jgi:hypothetical protein